MPIRRYGVVGQFINGKLLLYTRVFIIYNIRVGSAASGSIIHAAGEGHRAVS